MGCSGVLLRGAGELCSGGGDRCGRGAVDVEECPYLVHLIPAFGEPVNPCVAFFGGFHNCLFLCLDFRQKLLDLFLGHVFQGRLTLFDGLDRVIELGNRRLGVLLDGNPGSHELGRRDDRERHGLGFV